QTKRYVGLSSFGQSAIWSAESWTALDTSVAVSPCASSSALVLSGLVNGPIALASSGCEKPKSCSEWAASCCSTHDPKSPFGLGGALRAASPTSIAATTTRNVRTDE